MNALILLSSLGIIAMVSEIFGFKKFIWWIVVLSLIGIFFYSLTKEWSTYVRYYNDMMFVDNYALAFIGLLILLALAWFLISKDQYETGIYNRSDHYALILFSLVGGVVLVSFSNLSMLFLGIEILSIPLYILAGSNKNNLASNESSIKYFMMGAFATGIMLFGIALIYGAVGSFNLDLIKDYVEFHQNHIPALFYTGVFLIMIGLAFKVSAAPFHFWTPDVYEGAPVFITGFMATIVKTAGFAAFFRLFSTSFSGLIQDWGTTMSFMIGLTIILGNILAVYQTSVKRMLAYSGIAQGGYLLLTLLLLNDDAISALLLYSASYSLSSLCAFSVLYWVIKIKGNDSFDSFNALGKSHPVLAFVLTISMLSLAGIPPAIGFFAKFYLFAAVLKQGYSTLVVIAIIGSLISVYYYFRLIIAMYAKEGEVTSLNISYASKFVLLVMAGLIVFLGLSPGMFLNIIN